MRRETDLPDADEREWLLDALARLCGAAGARPLLTEPVLPTPRWFPDPWDGRAAGVERLTRRLLQYAGLARYGVVLEVAGEPLGSCEHAVAWFSGLRDGNLLLGVRTDLFDEPAAVGAALAHEVAHAWRHVHGIPDGEDLLTEEQLTDLTAVYLGFGVLTANGAALHRSQGAVEGGSARYTASHHRYGYLPMASLVFLLAAQLVAQGTRWRARRRVRAQLEANQAQVFDKACRLLRRDAAALRRRIGAPSHDRPVVRPEPGRLRGEVASLTGDPGLLAAASALPAWPHNDGRKVFRIRARRLRLALGVFGFGGAILAAVVSRVHPWYSLDGGWDFAADLAVGLGVGAVCALPFLRVHEWCSDESCRATLVGVEGTCPRCGSTISGTIRSATELPGLEDALEEPSPEDGGGDEGRPG